MKAGEESFCSDERDAALALIKKQSTLTLATSGQAGPWAAPVYYVYIDGSFYFFSSLQSRHIQQSLQSGQAAASLFGQADTWQSIRGIQMAGTVERVRHPALALKVIAAYLKHFPFTRDFFPDTPTPGPDAFFSKFKAKLFKFTPTQVFYIDNRFGIGNRRPIDW